MSGCTLSEGGRKGELCTDISESDEESFPVPIGGANVVSTSSQESTRTKRSPVIASVPEAIARKVSDRVQSVLARNTPMYP